MKKITIMDVSVLNINDRDAVISMTLDRHGSNSNFETAAKRLTPTPGLERERREYHGKETPKQHT